jgi:type IV pilus assembly protein PilX
MNKRHSALLTRTSSRDRNRGVVLIIALFVLLAITLMAVASMEMLGLNERMAGNFKDRQIAFQAGEAALRDAELVIRSDTDGPFSPLRPGEFSSTCTGGLCASNLGTNIFSSLSEADWAGPKTSAYGSQTGNRVLSGVASQPRYLIEYQGTTQPIEPGKPCVAVYSLSTRATGANSNTRVVLHSIFRMRVGECYAAI